MTTSFLFHIFPSSGVPIYRQVIEQTERLVSMGQLKAGDKLPSVRQVAEELAVNPMTISKAYMMLESQGILERLRGQGMVVAQRKTVRLSLEEKLTRLEPVTRQFLTLAHQLGVSEEQIITYLTSTLKGRGHD